MIHVGWTQIIPDLTWFQQEAQPKVHGHRLREISGQRGRDPQETYLGYSKHEDGVLMLLLLDLARRLHKATSDI
jgi:hypothetical protein